MKIALLADIHFNKYAEEDFRLHDITDVLDQTCDYCRDNGIKDLMLLGDFWSNRKTIDVQVLCVGHKALNKLASSFEKIVVIPGNHDFWYKSNDDVCSVHHFEHCCKVIKKPTATKVDDVVLFYFPYMESQERLLLHLEKTKSIVGKKAFFMHQCVLGCTTDSGFRITSGISHEKILSYCDIVFSGDIHTHQVLKDKSKQFVYVGSPLAQSFNDEGKKFGFIVFDTETLEWKRVCTKHREFHTITYETADKHEDKIKDNIVKIVFNGNEMWTREGVQFKLNEISEKYHPKRVVHMLTEQKQLEAQEEQQVENFEFKQLVKEYIRRNKPEGLNAKILAETFTNIKQGIQT